LEVIGGEEPDGLSDDVSPRPSQASESEPEAAGRGKGKGKGKGKAKAVDAPIISTPDAPPSDTKIPGKRRRPAVDPFAGYGDDPDARSPALAASGAKARRTHMEGVSAEASSGTNTPSGGEQRDRGKKSRKRPKKKRYP